MEPKLIIKKRVNCRITKRIVDLHQQGWDNDFLMCNNSELLSIQHNENYPLHAVEIELKDIDFNVLSRSFTYVYTIETYSGERGLLISPNLLQTSVVQRPKTNSIKTCFP